MSPLSPPPSPPHSESEQHSPVFPEHGYALTASKSLNSLRHALRAAKSNGGDRSGSTSEEDYDKITQSPDTLVLRRRKPAAREGSKLRDSVPAGAVLKGWTDDGELGEAFKNGLQRARTYQPARPRFSDLVFTRQFSAFDRQNKNMANSPFHGFFTLFWMGVGLFVFKIAAENWRNTGNVLGTNEIMKGMSGDVIFMLASDGVMCGLTAVSWLIQLLVAYEYLQWDRSGWIVQNVWQATFLAGVVGLGRIRSWPWTHTVYFVLHGITMLMKQHSYAFYNGYLSTLFKKRHHLLARLKQLRSLSRLPCPSLSPYLTTAAENRFLSGRPLITATSTPESDLARVAVAIDAGKPLGAEQVQLFESIITFEVRAVTEELKGKSTAPEREYPSNLTLENFARYIVLPTVVYELEYPRSKTINWGYVAEKGAATVGILMVMIMISQARMYPIIIKATAMKEAGIPLSQRLAEFPWIFLELAFPFMMEYLLTWYLIWESILNILAEITFFADRSFYDAWWNSVSWDQFARDWNRPVHNFLLRHVYHSSISSWKVGKHTATIITFLLSACVHELVMWCIFKKLRGYLLFLQMCQIPLMSLSRTGWLKGRKTLGNILVWFGLFIGPSMLCLLYCIL